MGNCFVQPRSSRVKPLGASPTPSVASTASPSTYACPVTPEFVARGNENPELSLKVVFGPESFVVLHPVSGLVLAGVSRVSQRELAVSTPDGRVIGTISTLKSGGLEFRHQQGYWWKAVVTEDRKIKITDLSDSEVCLMDPSTNQFVGTVRRGTDLVIVCALSSAIALN